MYDSYDMDYNLGYINYRIILQSYYDNVLISSDFINLKWISP